ncbi:MAG: trypsin-like peptidase domain-containing protein [Kineosporiaceae bacterium]|nr:trypsin-like peptidase domain-containing protein [Kineosporiaceae bacterium]
MTFTLPPPTDQTQPLPAVPPARRRPGWGGVIAVGAGAAVLSSMLTAGVITAVEPGASPAAVASSAPAAVDRSSDRSTAPVATSNGVDWVAVAAAVEPSVVSVQVAGRAGSGEGSGVVLDAQGRVLTNHHVISSALNGGGELAVTLSDGRTFAATVVGSDPATDLAVIGITDPPSGLTAAGFGDSSALRVGEPVMALGNPLGLSDTVTTGIVSALNRPVTAGSREQSPFGNGAVAESVVTNAIQTDAAINPGNSGGALVNASGQVIGITSSIATLGGGGQSGSIGLGFAIPANTAKDIAGQLIADGKATHAYLGVTLSEGTVTVDGALRRAAIVESVGEDTPAARASLEPGDAVTAIGGQGVDGPDSLIARIRELRPDSTVQLSVVRSGDAREVTVTLAARPAA